MEEHEMQMTYQDLKSGPFANGLISKIDYSVFKTAVTNGNIHPIGLIDSRVGPDKILGHSGMLFSVPTTKVAYIAELNVSSWSDMVEDFISLDSFSDFKNDTMNTYQLIASLITQQNNLTDHMAGPGDMYIAVPREELAHAVFIIAYLIGLNRLEPFHFKSLIYKLINPTKGDHVYIKVNSFKGAWGSSPATYEYLPTLFVERNADNAHLFYIEEPENAATSTSKKYVADVHAGFTMAIHEIVKLNNFKYLF